MAKIKNGILGGFSGKVGTVVGYNLYGEDHVRGLPKKKRYTAAEKHNQKKFKFVQAHLKPLKPLLKVGFKNYFTKTGGYRAAVAYTRKIAFMEDDAGFYIDPALFKISGGQLEGLKDPAVKFEKPGQLLFTWNTAAITYRPAESDQVMVLVYDTERKKEITRIFDGAFRKDGVLKVSVPAKFKGKTAEVYVAVVAADRGSQSDSQYLGQITIPK
ncbi:DUF6266 family protein [Pedobacter nutrimenti]|uniref:Uncharacterized protein n=1 Tax=Pedobacter nutrimenti TaxID=1241337 RepID=A0A318U9W4_9SPHI|nr:DUF6266 family protein [Pedobacter nutrimenti]PYF70772.1 hypothetical protein B0O44_108200 [Pedobacter nutrimenti]